jgi:hypothetical protein
VDRRGRSPRAIRRALLLGLGFALSACLQLQPLPTPTPSPEPSTTATMAFPTLFPTVTLTPPPSPSPTPDVLAGLGEVLYLDSFSRNLGWDLGQGELGGTSLLNGRLVIAVRRPGAFRYALSPAPDLTDFYLEVAVRSELCSSGDEFGIMFRVTPARDHYRFTLTCDGGARVTRIMGETSIALVPVTITGAVIPGAPADNLAAIRAIGSSFSFYVNGLEVFSVRDGNLASGGLGLIVHSSAAGQTTISFDDLVARALLPTPTPPPALPPTTIP